MNDLISRQAAIEAHTLYISSLTAAKKSIEARTKEKNVLGGQNQ